MAPVLLAALLVDALFGLWRPGFLRDMRPDLVKSRLRAALTDATATRAPPVGPQAGGTVLLVIAIVGAGGLGLALASLPLAGVWAIAVTALVLGMKRLSRGTLAVADSLRGSPDAARDAYLRFGDNDGTAPPVSDIAPMTYAALSPRMARDVLTPSLALLVFGLPGLLIATVIRALRDPVDDDANAPGRGATRLDALINWPARRIIDTLLDRFDPDAPDVPGPIHIEARVEALWKIWLCLLATVALLTLL